MDKKQIQILAGTGVGGLILGFLLGWMSFSIGDALDRAKEATKAAEKATVAAKKREAKAKKALKDAEDKAKVDLNKLRVEKEKEISAVNTSLEEAKAVTERLEITNRDLKERNVSLKQKMGIAKSRTEARAKDVPATARLVAALGRLRPAQAGLQAARAEVIARFESALVARPDVGPLQAAVAAYRKSVDPFGKAAREVEQVLSNNSKALKDAKVDMSTNSPHRKGIGDKVRKQAGNLANLFDSAAQAIESGKISVRAKSQGWTESEVTVNAREQVFVHAVGKWLAKYDWSEKDARGWPGEAQVQFRIKPSLPFGCLIVRVQGQDTEKILPAYGSDPITLQDAGRLEFRMNDKRGDDNSGRLSVEIIRISHEEIRRALKAAKKK